MSGERPHSRACGIRKNPHGPECHTNCPTCHGTTPAPPNPDTDGGRWIVDGGDGCTTEFDTEAEAVAYADACIQDWCDESWMEEVDNIFVARLTHRSQRHVVAVQGEVSDEEWERVTHGGSGFSEWWDYTIEPLAATPAPVTPPTPPETVPVPRAEDAYERSAQRRAVDPSRRSSAT